MDDSAGGRLERALDAMQDHAGKIGGQGVAVVAWLASSESDQWEARMRVVGRLIQENPDGKKFNLIAVAWSKAAEMCVSHRNSGDRTREKLTGELGYRGGVIASLGGGFVVAAFSGATSEQDVEISRAGLQAFA